MNAVIYARYSSHSQGEQSIEGQIKECYEYARKNKINIVGEYIDRATTGKYVDGRTQFKKMIKDSAKKQFDAVLVYQLDRFARNRFDSAENKYKLKKNGVKVISAKEHIPEDASGILVESVLEGMAEYYSAELSQKIKRGMLINVEKCLSTGGGLTLGYKTNENKEIIIDEDTAYAVKEIFSMYIKGYKMAEIVRYLNEQGIKTSRGNSFNKNSLHRILTNKRYIGIYTYKGQDTVGTLPAIIDTDVFEQAQKIMEKNKKAPARAKAVEERFYLTTKLFCGYCGSAMSGKSGTSKTKDVHYYYRCNNQVNKKGCSFKGGRKYDLEDIVIKNSRDFILTKGVIDKISAAVIELFNSDRETSNLVHLKNKLKEAMKAQNNLLDAVEKGLDIEIIAPRLKEKNDEINVIKANIAKEELKYETITKEEIKFFLEHFANGDINNQEFKQAFIDTFINKVYLWEDKITILYNVQDGYSDITLDDIKKEDPKANFDKSSLLGRLVEATGVEPVSEK